MRPIHSVSLLTDILYTLGRIFSITVCKDLTSIDEWVLEEIMDELSPPSLSDK